MRDCRSKSLVYHAIRVFAHIKNTRNICSLRGTNSYRRTLYQDNTLPSLRLLVHEELPVHIPVDLPRIVRRRNTDRRCKAEGPRQLRKHRRRSTDGRTIEVDDLRRLRKHRRRNTDGRTGEVDDLRRLRRHRRRNTDGRTGEVNDLRRLRRHMRHSGGATSVRDTRFLQLPDEDALRGEIKPELSLVRLRIYTNKCQRQILNKRHKASLRPTLSTNSASP